MILTCIKSHYADEDDNDESDKIPNHHLRFCPLGFIPHTQILFCANNRHLHFKEDWSLVSSSKTTATTSVSTEALCFKYEWSVENGERGSFDLLGLRTASRSAPATKAGRWYFLAASVVASPPPIAATWPHPPWQGRKVTCLLQPAQALAPTTRSNMKGEKEEIPSPFFLQHSSEMSPKQ